MRIEIHDLSEDDVNAIGERLEEWGYVFDEDYTVLYGRGLELVGLRFMNSQAACDVISILSHRGRR